MLSDIEIIESLKRGDIKIYPGLNGECINGVSLDFRLGNEFMVWNIDYNHDEIIKGIEIDNEYNYKLMRKVNVVDEDDFYLHPNQMVLSETVERLTLGLDVAAKVSGRSSLGRLGLIVHITADLFAPGWDGVPTLELKNVGPHTLMLKPGMNICSFSFYRLNGDVTNGYNGRYAGQGGVTVSR